MNVPKIRIKGFDGEWQSSQLSSIASIVKGEQLNKSSLSDAGTYYVLNGGQTPSGYTESYNTPGDTISISEGGNSCGYVAFNTENFWSGGHNYTLRNVQIDNTYLYAFLKSKEFYIMSKRVGSGLPNIQKAALQCLDVLYPPSSAEQQQIAEYFGQLDSLIESTGKKIASLKQTKRACLQSMFPQPGETTPRIRFKGFEGEWESSQLSSIASIVKGEQLNKSSLSDAGTYYVLNGGQTPSGYTESYNTPGDTISISEGGNSCGYVAFNTENFWSGGHNYTLRNVQIDNTYLYAFLKSKEFYIMSKRVGSGLPNIQKAALQCLNVLYPPSSAEQQQISAFFSNMDKLIRIQEQRLEKLKQIKAACLENMFV